VKNAGQSTMRHSLSDCLKIALRFLEFLLHQSNVAPTKRELHALEECATPEEYGRRPEELALAVIKKSIDSEWA
jgi:hypothetical protein